MTYLKFAIPNYYLLTGTIFLASIQPSSTWIQTTYSPSYQKTSHYCGNCIATSNEHTHTHTHTHVISHIWYKKQNEGVGVGEKYDQKMVECLDKCTEMITAAFGFNTTMVGEAVNYMSPSDCGGTYTTKEMNKLCCMHWNHHSGVWSTSDLWQNKSLKTAKENYTTNGQLQYSIPFLIMNQIYAHM